MKNAKYQCDLHTHTICSDGSDQPKEAVDKAAALGIKVLAITDHDVVPQEFIEENGSMVKLTEYAVGKGVCYIPGMEISCDTENEDVHLVCLGCDWTHAYFQKLEDDIQKSKLESYRVLIENFRKLNYAFEWEDVLEKTGNKNTPYRIQKKQIFQYIADHGVVPDWSSGKKLVQTTPELMVKRRKPNPLEVIREIHKTGGMVILAHPYLISEPVWWQGEEINRENYIRMLIAAGLDGIEARYTYDKTSYRGTMTKDEIEQEVIRLFGSDVSILSGGSDYHGETKNQVSCPRMQGEEGITYEYMEENPLLKKFLV